MDTLGEVITSEVRGPNGGQRWLSSLGLSHSDEKLILSMCIRSLQHLKRVDKTGYEVMIDLAIALLAPIDRLLGNKIPQSSLRGVGREEF